MKDWIKPQKEEFNKKQTEEDPYATMTVEMFSFLTLEDDILALLGVDASLVVVAFTFVFIYFVFNLGSVFLSLAGISIIFLSFPITAVITHGILQVKYFGSLQIIGIFLVIGIAADDIFVFLDAWKQSSHVGPEQMKKDNGNGDPNAEKKRRLAYAFRRGVRAMSVTSSTTAVAFFANLFSTIMPIRAFGVFSGVLIPMNFILVIIVMPPAVIWWESKINEPYKTCCWDKRTDEELEEFNNKEATLGKAEVFFDGTFNNIIERARYPIAFVTIIWAGLAIYFGV
jgi:predicted RND superfamily exporter protein